MTVDIHAHAVPNDLIRSLASEVPELAPQVEKTGDGWTFVYPDGRRSGPMPAGMFDLDERVADMDRAGVSVQALSVPPTHFAYRLDPAAAATAVGLHNDAMLAMSAARRDRFLVLAALPLQSPVEALAEIERMAAQPEVVGVEIGTNVRGRNLDDPDLEPVWASLAELGLAVVLHPDNVAGGDRMQDHYLHNFIGNPTDTTLAAGALMFGGVLSRYPGLRIALLHGGGFLPYQIGRLAHGWMVRPEPRRILDVSPGSCSTASGSTA